MGMCFSPSIAVIGHYFQRKRPLVMGISASGAALAGIVLPIILDKMLNHSSLGFAWSQRVVGFIILFLALIAAAVITPGLPNRKGNYLLLEAFKKPAYTLQVIGLFFVFWGLVTPIFFLPSYAEYNGVGSGLAFHLVTNFSAGSFVGRLVAGGLGLRYGQFNVLSVC